MRLVRHACLAVTALVVVACGTPKSETRTVDAFTKIVVGNGAHLVFTQGPLQPLGVTADVSILPHVLTTVADDTLTIALEPGTNDTSMIGTTVEVQAPGLVSIETNGGAEATIGALTGEDLAVNAGGGSRISATSITVKTLAVTGAAGSTVTLGGTSEAIEATLSGGAQLDAPGLTTHTAALTLSGGSSASLKATDSVSGSVTGGSHATITGAPGTRTVTADVGSDVSFP